MVSKLPRIRLILSSLVIVKFELRQSLIFWGFEFRWGENRWGKPILKRRTSRDKLRAFLVKFKAWFQKHSGLPKNYQSGQSDHFISSKHDNQGRGNATWDRPKRGYQIKLDTKANILGMSADKDSLLIANYADRSLIRYVAALELSNRINKAAGSCYTTNKST